MAAFVSGLGLGRGSDGKLQCNRIRSGLVSMVAPSVPDLVRDVKQLRGFHEFFTKASGSWNAERNYHYMEDEDEEASTESSRMTFDVERLGNNDKREVRGSIRTLVGDGDQDIVTWELRSVLLSSNRCLRRLSRFMTSSWMRKEWHRVKVSECPSRR
mmetsp:Transcript_28766/g.112179  ORF Transcript_28766/g.112179 Transcript_28766/m.112179 type:complete len:157 (-) Transcript_28766:661-1131(-)